MQDAEEDRANLAGQSSHAGIGIDGARLSRGKRAADLGAAVLKGLDWPAYSTTGLFRSAQAGADYLVNGPAHNGHATKNGGYSDE